MMRKRKPRQTWRRGKRQREWTEDDVLGVFFDSFLAVELGAPRIVSAEQMEQARRKIIAEKGLDLAELARERAKRIRDGLEPVPELFGYHRVVQDEP